MRKLYSVLLSFLFITSAFAQAPTNGLVAEWLFTYGSMIDGVGNVLASHPASVLTAPDRFGSEHNSRNINPGGYINLGGDIFDNITTGANATFAYSFWLKLDAFDNNYKCIMAKASFETPCQIAGRQYAILVTPTGKIQLQAFGSITGGNHARVDGSTTLSVGTWHHIVISVDMATLLSSLPSTTGLTMYVDGNLETLNVSEISGSGILPSGMQDGVAHLGVGTYLNTAGSPCVSSQDIDAHFDDFRIYDRTLNAADVEALNTDVGCAPVTITQQPQNVAQCVPDLQNLPNLSVSIAESSATYEWQVDLGSGWQAPSQGGNGPSISSINGIGQYRVKIFSACGTLSYSEEATVVFGEPVIASQSEGTPGSPIFLCPAKGSVELSVDAIGENVTYQWYSAADGFPPLSFQSISGATDPTYDAMNGSTYYRVEVTACGQTLTSEDIYVVLGAQPTINIINVSNGGTICLGGSATMTISTSNAGQASWEPNNGTPMGAQAYSVSPSETTTYTVTGTNSQSGCTATASTVITVVDPQPAIVENNGVLEITGGSFTNIIWYLNGSVVIGANQSIYTPVADGDYTVSVSQNGCNSTSDPYAYTGVATGIEDASANSLKVYPNPFNSEFIVETNELTAISVMNAMGEVVLSRTVNGRTSIDATNLSVGIYFVREETSGAVMKLVKN
jgi:hypothetical protein